MSDRNDETERLYRAPPAQMRELDAPEGLEGHQHKRFGDLDEKAERWRLDIPDAEMRVIAAVMQTFHISPEYHPIIDRVYVSIEDENEGGLPGASITITFTQPMSRAELMAVLGDLSQDASWDIRRWQPAN